VTLVLTNGTEVSGLVLADALTKLEMMLSEAGDMDDLGNCKCCKRPLIEIDPR
jgi:hypothetical protein